MHAKKSIVTYAVWNIMYYFPDAIVYTFATEHSARVTTANMCTIMYYSDIANYVSFLKVLWIRIKAIVRTIASRKKKAGSIQYTTLFVYKIQGIPSQLPPLNVLTIMVQVCMTLLMKMNIQKTTLIMLCRLWL